MVSAEPAARLILFEWLGRQQKLHSKVPDEKRLVVSSARRSNAAARHQKKNERRMDFIARADADSVLAGERIVGADAVELRVHFELLRKVVTGDDAGDPAV